MPYGEPLGLPPQKAAYDLNAGRAGELYNFTSVDIQECKLQLLNPAIDYKNPTVLLAVIHLHIQAQNQLNERSVQSQGKWDLSSTGLPLTGEFLSFIAHITPVTYLYNMPYTWQLLYQIEQRLSIL